MDLITNMKKTTYILLPFVGLELYGFEFVFALFIFFCLLAIFDTGLGLYIARINKVTSSKSGSEGLALKIVWIIFFMIMTGGLAHMGYTIKNDNITSRLSLILILIYGFRIAFEFVSIIENIAIISDKREKGVLTWIVSIFTWIGGIGQKKVEEKLERYLGEKKK